MNVSLTPELEAFVHDKVATGRYNSASEVVRESLRLLEDREWNGSWSNDELRIEIAKGIDDIRNGRYISLETDEDFDALAEEIKTEGRKRLEQRKHS